MSRAIICSDNDDFLTFNTAFACIMIKKKTQRLMNIACQHASRYLSRRYSVSDVNSSTCSDNSTHDIDTNHEGHFCGRCKEGYGLAACIYSYHYTTCIPCRDYGYKNWIKYFVIALLPLTLFYFLVVILRINVTSSHFNGIVFSLQCLMSPPQL